MCIIKFFVCYYDLMVLLFLLSFELVICGINKDFYYMKFCFNIFLILDFVIYFWCKCYGIFNVGYI